MKNKTLDLAGKLPAYLLLLLAALALFPFLGGVHLFDWDEVNFAAIAREMLIRGDWSTITVNFEPFYEKPPLFFWMQALSMYLFGVGEYAARFPNAVCGILTLVLLMYYGKKVRTNTFGFLWAALYLCSFLPHLYFRSGIIDPWLNLFMFVAIMEYYLSEGKPGLLPLGRILAGIAIGLAVLTKGPVGWLIPVGLFLLSSLWYRMPFWKAFLRLAIVTLLTLLTASTWYFYEFATHGTEFIQAFIAYQWDLFTSPGAGHAGFPGYHVIVLLFGCFPASILCLNRIQFGREDDFPFRPWMDRMRLLIILVLVLFTLVESKIVHYSSMAYFPITFIAARSVDSYLEGKSAFPGWQKAFFLLTGILIALLFLFFSFIRPHHLEPYFHNNAEILAILQGPAPVWTGLEWLPGTLLLAGLVLLIYFFRKGQKKVAFLSLVLICTLFVVAAVYSFVPKIEVYSQRPLVEFYKRYSESDAYLVSYGFKSYLPYYYGKVEPGNAIIIQRLPAALWEGPDRQIYLAVKRKQLESVQTIPGMEELYREGNFVFFRRKVAL